VAVSRIRDNNIAASSAFTIAVDVTRTRNLSSEDAAVFTAVINGLRSRDVNINAEAAFSLTANVQRTTDIVLTAFTNSTLTALGVVERSTGSSLSSQANITVDVARSRDVASTLTTTASLSVPGERTREIQADLASEYAITILGQRTTDIVLTAFTNGTLSVTAIVNRTLASSQSVSAALTVVGGLSIVSSATMTSRATVRGYLDVLVRNYALTQNTGGIYNTAVIDNSVYKFGGGSLTWDEVTRAFTDSQPVVSESTFYFFQAGYTWSSTNGTTWTRTTNNLSVDPSRTDSQVVRENGYFIFFDGSNTIYYSTNGTTWSSSTGMLSVIQGTGIRLSSNTVHYYNNNYYLFGNYVSGVLDRIGWISTNSLSGSWSANYYTTGSESRDTYKSTNGVVVPFVQNSTLYLYRGLITSPTSVIVGTGMSALQASYDGSNTYGVITSFGGSDHYLYYSKNNGSSWNAISSPTQQSNDLQYVNGYWFISADDGLYATSDIASGWTKVHDYNVGTVLWNGTRFLSTLLERPGFVITSTTAVSDWTVSQVNDISGVGGSLSYATGQLSATGTIDLWIATGNESNLNDIRKFGSTVLRIKNSYNSYLTISAYTYSEVTLISVNKSLSLSDSASLYKTSNTNLSNDWIHLRFVQSGSSAALYVNGQRLTGTGNIGYSTSWPNGAISGNVEILQRDVSYIDELLITTDVLTDPSTTSFSVPTNRWNNTANTKLLLHFNDGFADDSRFQVIPEARLTVAASMTVTTNADYVESFALSATATLSVQGQRTTDIVLTAFTNGALTANNTRTRDNDSSQSSAFSQTASAVRSRDNSSSLNASASVTANNTRTRAFDSNLSAFATTVTVAQETSEISANLSAAFNTVQRYIEDGAFETGYFATSDIIANYIADGRSTLASAFTVNADSDYLTNFSASLSSSASLTAVNTRTRSDNSSSMSSAATVTAAVAKTTVTSVALSSSATLTVIGIKGSEIALYAFTNATLTASVKRTRATASSMASSATLYVDTANSLNKLTESYLSSAFTQTATANRTRSTTVTLQAFAAEVTVNRRQRTAFANLSSAFTLTANGSRGIILASSMSISATVTAIGKKTVSGTISMSAAMTATMIVREIRTDTIVYRIPAEGWIYNIAAEQRLYAINGETRVFRMKSESRVRNIAEETRILTIN